MITQLCKGEKLVRSSLLSQITVVFLCVQKCLRSGSLNISVMVSFSPRLKRWEAQTFFWGVSIFFDMIRKRQSKFPLGIDDRSTTCLTFRVLQSFDQTFFFFFFNWKQSKVLQNYAIWTLVESGWDGTNIYQHTIER